MENCKMREDDGQQDMWCLLQMICLLFISKAGQALTNPAAAREFEVLASHLCF
jgi:hypothetical protein